MEAILENFAILIGNNSNISIIIAFIAGIITACMPCFLSTLPLIISYVASVDKSPKNMFKLALTFILGNTLTFILLGIFIGAIGSIFSKLGTIYYLVLGIVMILMALQTFGIFEFIKPTYLTSKNKKKGYLGAFIAGVLSGIFSSPCQTPVLVALLAMVLQKGTILYGIITLLAYSLGNGIIILIIIMSLNKIKDLKKNKAYETFNKVINYILGIAMLLLGFYMFYMGF